MPSDGSARRRVRRHRSNYTPSATLQEAQTTRLQFLFLLEANVTPVVECSWLRIRRRRIGSLNPGSRNEQLGSEADAR
ncbi:hypothetical protein TNCV_610981 [Trichonephila clavipes]|nr:hypothetical protein TNCV_610981 [Trichonephila clavipes]